MVKFKVTKKRPKKPTTEKEKEQSREMTKKHVGKLGRAAYKRRVGLR